MVFNGRGEIDWRVNNVLKRMRAEPPEAWNWSAFDMNTLSSITIELGLKEIECLTMWALSERPSLRSYIQNEVLIPLEKSLCNSRERDHDWSMQGISFEGDAWEVRCLFLMGPIIFFDDETHLAS